MQQNILLILDLEGTDNWVLNSKEYNICFENLNLPLKQMLRECQRHKAECIVLEGSIKIKSNLLSTSFRI
jgi:hypothetical protein